MNIHEYIDRKKKLYSIFLQFIEGDKEIDSKNFDQLTNIIESQNIFNDKKEFEDFLCLVIKIFKHHHRNQDFFQKIEQILLYLKDQLNHSFTNIELFNFFKRTKRILLFLITNQILILDEIIINYLTNPVRIHYFYPEVKEYLSKTKKEQIERQLLKMDAKIIEKFDEIRSSGENFPYISQIIRKDSLDEFIIHVNKTNIPLTSTIKRSIFESNHFLIKNEASLIEYAAFFGSIRIFQYLKMNKVELKPSLWIFAIHSNDPELIYQLEENHLKPEDKSFDKCLKESIKCHHNQIANYIRNHFIGEEMEKFRIEHNYDNILTYSFHYKNYDFLSNDLTGNFVFFNACKYGYFPIVKYFVETKKVNINAKIILFYLFLIIKLK